MNTEVTTNKTFQEKMFERIRDQMGDLMSEEELKSIVDTAMQKAFFGMQTSKDSYGRDNGSKESVFVEMIREHMRAKVGLAVQEWLKAHDAEVLKAIDETIAKGFFNLVQQHMEQKISSPLYNFAEALRQKGVFIP